MRLIDPFRDERRNFRQEGVGGGGGGELTMWSSDFQTVTQGFERETFLSSSHHRSQISAATALSSIPQLLKL